MSIFTYRDIKRLFIILSCIFTAFILLSQLYQWLCFGAPNAALLILSLFLAIGILSACFVYFQRQQHLIENAISQIDLFISGNVDARIECGGEGSLYKLFHEINTLSTTLNAEAVRQHNTKAFLRNTISDISHQLKTPLAALAIYNSLLQDEGEDLASVREFALKSEKELDRIETLIQSLLKITRLDSGSIVMDRHKESISDMIGEISEHFRIRAEQEKKSILLSGPEETTLFCDRVWLMEALSNLVKNALDHTGESGQVEVLWKSLPSSVQITVKDNGSGIHPEDVYHIFKRFYRSRFSKDTQGIGLGLPLAKAIIEAHDGTIEVDSELGKGSIFVMNFLHLTKE